jgi:hypothetical protein
MTNLAVHQYPAFEAVAARHSMADKRTSCEGTHSGSFLKDTISREWQYRLTWTFNGSISRVEAPVEHHNYLKP